MPMPNDMAKMLVRPAIDTTPAEVLRWLTRAQGHIREPQFWCRGYAALDKNDLMVAAADPAAVRRCAIGAVYADSPESCPGGNAEAPVVRQAIAALNRSAAAIISLRPPPNYPSHTSCEPIVYLNDAPEFGHRLVIKAYEDAKAEQRMLAISG